MYLLGILRLTEHAAHIPRSDNLLYGCRAAALFVHIFNTEFHRLILLFLVFLRSLQILLCLRDLLTGLDQITFQFRNLIHQSVQL